MRVLVVGSGGREHALAWKLAASPRLSKLYCLPGNPGMASLGELVGGDPGDVAAIAGAATRLRADLTVIGPEAPLVNGVGDEFARRGLRLFGPDRAGARLEGSKSYARELMARCGVPGPAHAVFTDPRQAGTYLRSRGGPAVVKADGLAAGKGVTVAADLDAALAAVQSFMEDRIHGEAGCRVVIEERLEGEELSVLALVDGDAIRLLPASQDHKRVGDGDRGANTGGMGAYSPVAAFTPELAGQVQATVLQPVVSALRQRGTPYRGILYAGLMLTAAGLRVLEFNVRSGDPETQVILPRLDGDFLELAVAVAEGRLDAVRLRVRPQAAVCVVLAAPGYPGPCLRGLPITGLERAARVPGVILFHAGTAQDAGGSLVTAGGRVLGVTALGDTLRQAVERAYEAAGYIHFDGVHYRRDIAHRALGWEVGP